MAIKTTQEQVQADDIRIAEQQRRIDDLTIELQTKFYAADALIASLEQRASYFINMFQAMKSNTDAMS